jgi:hypothetical protein
VSKDDNGWIGDSKDPTGRWTQNKSVSCDSLKAALYCFQDDDQKGVIGKPNG